MKLVNKACSMYNKQPMPIKVLLILAVVSIICCLTSCGVFAMESFKNPVNAVYYLHSNTCGHCKKFNPVWDKFVSSMDGSGIPFKKIEQAQLADLQKKMAAEGKDFPTINGFPTVLKTDGTEFDEFKSDRTVAALTTWVKQE